MGKYTRTTEIMFFRFVFQQQRLFPAYLACNLTRILVQSGTPSAIPLTRSIKTNSHLACSEFNVSKI